MRRVFGSLLLGALLGACGDDTATTDLSGFVLDDNEKKAIEDAERDGKQASGAYNYDTGSKALSITFNSSGFVCDGPSTTEALQATVVELSATEMEWELDGDDLEWRRVDAGTQGLIGVWKADDADGDFFLILAADGSATLVGPEDCDDSRPRNGENCVELGLFGASIVVDGDLADWNAVGGSATIEDQRDDHSGNDAGADIRAMKFEIERGNLLVLLQLNSPPSEDFQARSAPNGAAYRLHLRSEGGENFYSRVAYSPEAQQWELIEPQGDSGVSFAVGSDGIEWSISDSRFSTPEKLSIIRVEIQDCGSSSGNCPLLDEIDNCGYFPGFSP